jgi:hypothetical protein
MIFMALSEVGRGKGRSPLEVASGTGAFDAGRSQPVTDRTVMHPIRRIIHNFLVIVEALQEGLLLFCEVCTAQEAHGGGNVSTMVA